MRTFQRVFILNGVNQIEYSLKWRRQRTSLGLRVDPLILLMIRTSIPGLGAVRDRSRLFLSEFSVPRRSPESDPKKHAATDQRRWPPHFRHRTAEVVAVFLAVSGPGVWSFWGPEDALRNTSGRVR